MSFTRRVEDFTCERCGAKVRGNGYTNHCPRCLWSRHVDVSPGDRAEICGGMMEPVRVEGASPAYAIVHRCAACGVERRICAAQNDSADALVKLAAGRDKS